jgi:putative copper export protein
LQRSQTDRLTDVLSPSLATFRIFLHVLASTVWVGGQLTLAGLVPGLRALHPDAPRTVARAYNRIAWPAFGLAVATGIWNVAVLDVSNTTTAYQLTLALKLTMVALSGVAAAAHIAARTKVALAIGGAVGLLAALVALFLGVLLHVR